MLPSLCPQTLNSLHQDKLWPGSPQWSHSVSGRLLLWAAGAVRGALHPTAWRGRADLHALGHLLSSASVFPSQCERWAGKWVSIKQLPVRNAIALEFKSLGCNMLYEETCKFGVGCCLTILLFTGHTGLSRSNCGHFQPKPLYNSLTILSWLYQLSCLQFSISEISCSIR